MVWVRRKNRDTRALASDTGAFLKGGSISYDHLDSIRLRKVQKYNIN